MCGIALVWHGVVLKPVQPTSAEPEPLREQWEGVDESPAAALARSGLHGAQLLQEVSDNAAAAPEAFTDELTAALHRRGPDARGRFLLRDPSCVQGGPEAAAAGRVRGAMWASVLHLRGQVLCAQPVRDEAGNALVWNGEVFGGNLAVGADDSDTQLVFDRISYEIARGWPSSETNSASFGGMERGEQTSSSAAVADSYIVTRDAIARTLGGVQGEFAFVFWEAAGRRLWFGRDRLGRRSLLIKKKGRCEVRSAGGQEGWERWVAICSNLGHVPEQCFGNGQEEAGQKGEGADEEDEVDASSAGGWEEVRPDGFYCLQLDGLDQCAEGVIGKYAESNAKGCGERGEDAGREEEEAPPIIHHCNWPEIVPLLHRTVAAQLSTRAEAVAPRAGAGGGRAPTDSNGDATEGLGGSEKRGGGDAASACDEFVAADDKVVGACERFVGGGDVASAKLEVRGVPSVPGDVTGVERDLAVDALMQHLDESVRRRVRCISEQVLVDEDARVPAGEVGARVCRVCAGIPA